MKSPNTIEAELNKTRVRLYEETKDMTVAEHVAYIHALSAPIIQKYGLKTLSRTDR